MIVNAFDNGIVLFALGSHFNDNLLICILGFFFWLMLEHCICFTDWTLKHARVIFLPSWAYILGEVFSIVWTNTVQSLPCWLDVKDGLFIKLQLCCWSFVPVMLLYDRLNFILWWQIGFRAWIKFFEKRIVLFSNIIWAIWTLNLRWKLGELPRCN